MISVLKLDPPMCRRCDAEATHYVQDHNHTYCGAYCLKHAEEKAAQMRQYADLVTVSTGEELPK